MALGANLAGLLGMLRAEARLTQNVGAGLNADITHRVLLARHQDDLWMLEGWKHLEVSRDITTDAGVRLYTWPVDLAFDRAVSVKAKWSSLWIDLSGGIDERHYNEVDPEQDSRQDPVRAWDLAEGNVLELWPLPASTGTMVRLTGTKALPPLVADSDVAIMDDRLIVLYAAAELLALQKAPDAPAKLAAANRRLLALRGNMNKNKVRSFLAGQGRGFGGVRPSSELRIIGGRGSIGAWDGPVEWAE